MRSLFNLVEFSAKIYCISNSKFEACFRVFGIFQFQTQFSAKESSQIILVITNRSCEMKARARDEIERSTENAGGIEGER